MPNPNSPPSHPPSFLSRPSPLHYIMVGKEKGPEWGVSASFDKASGLNLGEGLKILSYGLFQYYKNTRKILVFVFFVVFRMTHH